MKNKSVIYYSKRDDVTEQTEGESKKEKIAQKIIIGCFTIWGIIYFAIFIHFLLRKPISPEEEKIFAICAAIPFPIVISSLFYL